ncbi:RNA recognition motif-containing protein RRM, partial [Reticulomyxa filosa]
MNVKQIPTFKKIVQKNTLKIQILANCFESGEWNFFEKLCIPEKEININQMNYIENYGTQHNDNIQTFQSRSNQVASTPFSSRSVRNILNTATPSAHLFRRRRVEPIQSKMEGPPPADISDINASILGPYEIDKHRFYGFAVALLLLLSLIFFGLSTSVQGIQSTKRFGSTLVMMFSVLSLTGSIYFGVKMLASMCMQWWMGHNWVHAKSRVEDPLYTLQRLDEPHIHNNNYNNNYNNNHNNNYNNNHNNNYNKYSNYNYNTHNNVKYTNHKTYSSYNRNDMRNNLIGSIGTSAMRARHDVDDIFQQQQQQQQMQQQTQRRGGGVNE